MRQRIFVLTVLALAVLLAMPLTAQQTATIRGTVIDENGDPVPGAKVTAIGVETGLLRETATNEAGFFNASSLPVGLYTLSVEKEGFSVALVSDIPLSVAEVREVDVTMMVGAITDEITTTSSAIVVRTIGGEIAGLITGEQVRELPLNGRNFLQLTLLMPGVSAPDGFNTKNKGLLTGSDLSVSGGSTTGNSWTVDGANNNDVGSNRTILVYPSLEAVEEFKIHRNSYGAEFGGGGGAQVNLVTRGGTNDFKGSVFAFARRDSWNETNALLREFDQPKAPLDRDDYGYTIGGPIKKDKVHFFLSQEWNVENRGIARSAAVPTALEKQGDFSQSNPDCNRAIVDPLTGLPFPGNVIPADRINPTGQAYLGLYPDANITDSCINWVAAVVTPIDWEQINGRLDYTVNDRHRVLLRYTEDDWTNPVTAGDANGLWGDDPFPSVDSNWAQPSDSIVAQLNSVIGTTAINTLTFSTSGNEILIGEGGSNPEIREALVSGIPTFFPAADKSNGGRGFPIFWGNGILDAVWTQSPWNNLQDIKLFKDDYEQVFGDHVVKAGVLYSEAQKLEVLENSSSEQGILGGWGPWPGHATGYVGNEWGGNSGNVIADFLLNDMYFGFSERSQSPLADIRWEDIEVYVADSWKVSPNLTLDAGIRYSYYVQPYNADNNLFLSFNPDRFDPALGNDPCNGLMQVPGTNPCGDAGFIGGTFGPNEALINEDSDNFAPRLGLAWDMKGDGSRVLRFGLGQFFQRDRVSPHFGLAGNPPVVQSASGLRTWEGDFLGVGTSLGRPGAGWDVNRQTPYNIQFNIGFEQQLGANSTLEVAYVGSRGRHLLQSNQINYVPEGRDVDGNGVSDRIDFAQCPPGDQACQANYQLFGVFGNGAITYWTTQGESEYDSIQTQYITRFGRGSQFQASYTWSKFDSKGDVAGSSGGLDATETVTDPDNRALDWGPAETHREHVLNASLIHNLPTFEGQGGFKEWILGNWAVGGILSYSSGTPITVFTGGFDGLGTGGGGTGYADAQRPLRVPGVPCGGGGGRQFLNPDAYTLDGYVLGNTAQQVRRGDCEGPDFFQVDLSLYKNIPFGNRVNAQLRIEMFNVFDETNWFDVDNQWDSTTTYNADRTQVVSSIASTGFGIARRARDPRELQLGIKLTF